MSDLLMIRCWHRSCVAKCVCVSETGHIPLDNRIDQRAFLFRKVSQVNEGSKYITALLSKMHGYTMYLYN